MTPLIHNEQCKFLGESTNTQIKCEFCGSEHIVETLHACEIHGHCTLNRKANKDTQCCRICLDHIPLDGMSFRELPRAPDEEFPPMLEEERIVSGPSSGNICDSARRDMSVEEMLALIRKAPPGPWPTRKIQKRRKWKDDPQHTWHCWDNTHEAMRILAQEFIDAMPEYPGHYKGRGILIAGGGLRYLPSVWVNVNKLRHVGCKLPIQLWYMGDNEVDPYFKKLLKSLGVECIDARQVEKHIPSRILCGWELKLYATVHCSFKEVIFLDADNHVLRDPIFLFDEPEYLKHGAVFWPDYSFWDLDPGVFRVFGIPERREPAFESGQYIVDKERCWDGLIMADWYAQHSDFTFGHVYGDKECYHLGWRKMGLDYGMPPHTPGWSCNNAGGKVIVQKDFQGNNLFLHRVQDKWNYRGGNVFCNDLPDEQLHHNFVDDLRRIWPGKLWSNPVPSPREKEVIQSLCHQTFLYRRLARAEINFPGDSRTLELLPSSRIGAGAAECEARWEINEVLRAKKAQMILSVCRDDRPTCHLVLSPDGVWRGTWLENEKCDVELVPVNHNKAESVGNDLDRLTRDVAALVRKYGYTCGDDEEVKQALRGLVTGN